MGVALRDRGVRPPGARRAGRLNHGGPLKARPPITARISDRSTVVEVHDRLYVRLDAEGRWTTFAEGGAHFRRTVEGRVVRPAGRGFVELGASEADTVHAWVVRRAGELVEALTEARPGTVEWLGAKTVLLERLRRAACASPDERAATERSYLTAYPEPVPILPPHRYRDVVVLPATGCPNHSCTFCAFYRERPFRVLEPERFRTHLEAVRDLFGEALAERDGVFLGSASALSIADPALGVRLRDVAEVLGRPRRGIASFLDPDRAPRRPAEAWAALADAGLREATLGLETGLAALRVEVGKSGDLERFRGAVAALKEGGLEVSLTILVGLGGKALAPVHRAATVDFVATLPLGPKDRVYLSPLSGVWEEGPLERELAAWRDALGGRSDARVGDYRIERFVWLA